MQYLNGDVEVQTPSKVEGHAKLSDVEGGRVRPQDKVGNDWADWFVDKGALQYELQEGTSNNPALKRWIADWSVSRHKKYVDFRVKIDNVIVAVLKTETAERQKRKEVKTWLQGYDDEILSFNMKHNTSLAQSLRTCAKQQDPDCPPKIRPQARCRRLFCGASQDHLPVISKF